MAPGASPDDTRPHGRSVAGARAKILGAVALLALVGAGARARGGITRTCVGRAELVPMTDALRERASELPLVEPSLVRTSTSEHCEGGSFETDWALGPFTAHESGTFYRLTYPSSVTVSLTDACDEATFQHDEYKTGKLEARHDPASDLWFVATATGPDDKPSFTRLTALRSVRAPSSQVRLSTAALLVLASAAALAFAAASERRRRRHASRAGFSEAVVDASGVARGSDGVRVRLAAPPAAGSRVLYEAPSGPRASTYRDDELPVAAAHVVSTRDQETQAARARARAALVAVAASLLLSALSALSALSKG